MGVGHPQLPAHGSEGLTVHVPPFIHKLGTTVYTLIGRWRNLKTCSTACRHTRRAAGWAVRTTPQQYSACMTNAGQIWTVAGVNSLHALAQFNNFVPTLCQLSTTHTLECACSKLQATLEPPSVPVVIPQCFGQHHAEAEHVTRTRQHSGGGVTGSGGFW